MKHSTASTESARRTLEDTLLGSMMDRPNTIRSIRETGWTPDMMSSAPHRELASAIIALDDAGELPRPEVVVHHLAALDKLEAAGGAETIRALVDISCAEDTYTSLPDLLAWRLVRDWLRRESAAAARHASLAMEGGEDLDAALTAMHDRIVAARKVARRDEGESYPDLLEMMDAPPPDYLIDEILVSESFIVVFGAPKSGKTFAVLAWAVAIVCGSAWLGQTARAGNVAYVAGEGAGGFGARLYAAAVGARGVLADRIERIREGLVVRTRPVEMTDPAAVSAFIRELQDRRDSYELVVLDTLARNFGAADENSTEDMGRFVAGCDLIRHTLGCAVLVVHHTGHAGGRERGSSALRAAADDVISVEVDDEEARHFTIRSVASKESDGFRPIEAQLAVVDLPGDRRTSCCVIERPQPIGGSERPLEDDLAILRAVQTHYSQGGSASQIATAAGVKRDQFYPAAERLSRAGRLVIDATGNTTRYRPAGAEEESA